MTGSADLLTIAEANGCRARSFFANRPGGGLVGYFPTQLSLPNRSFLDVYPGGVLPQVPVVVVCGPGGTPRPIATPTPTPTPIAPPAPNQPPVVTGGVSSNSSQLVSVPAASTVPCSVAGSLIEIDGGRGGSNDNLGSFSRTFDPEVAGLESTAEDLACGGGTTSITYRVRMDVQ